MLLDLSAVRIGTGIRRAARRACRGLAATFFALPLLAGLATGAAAKDAQDVISVLSSDW
ncbi:MAG: hypothetical protein OXC65_09665 [Thiotrichales bacterium]|nr:hypothetical protein [Thiotrichales bacterium]